MFIDVGLKDFRARVAVQFYDERGSLLGRIYLQPATARAFLQAGKSDWGCGDSITQFIGYDFTLAVQFQPKQGPAHNKFGDKRPGFLDQGFWSLDQDGWFDADALASSLPDASQDLAEYWSKRASELGKENLELSERIHQVEERLADYEAGYIIQRACCAALGLGSLDNLSRRAQGSRSPTSTDMCID